MSGLKPNAAQLEAIRTIDANVSVSAGAGSGKTRVLVERYLYILEQEFARREALRKNAASAKNIAGNFSIEKEIAPENLARAADAVSAGANGIEKIDAANILAITFTRNAAGEMKERVRAGMEERAAKTGGAAKKFWQEQLEALDKAQISTIHGLCSHILRAHPVENGLDPSFSVLEEFDADEFMDGCLDEFLRQQLRDKDPETLALLNAYGYQNFLRELKCLLPQLEEIAAEADLRAPYQENIGKLPRIKEELAACLEKMVQECCAPPAKKSKKALSKTAEQLALLAENLAVVAEEIRQDEYAFLDEITAPMQAKGKAGEYVKAVRALRKQIAGIAADRAALDLMGAWQKILRGFAKFARARKLAQDALTYDDLENMTLALLREDASVRRKFQQRFRYIMVDEFQDTNDRQRQLAYLLCGDSCEQLGGAKLFIVGDPKQSIYRFRGADVSVFARVRRDIAGTGGKNISLSVNYRSSDKVLNAVNEAFRQLMGVDAAQDVYFEELQCNRSGEEVPQLLSVSVAEDDDKFRAEADAVAEAIKNFHEGKNLAGEEIEPVAYGGMAILLRALTHSAELAEACAKRGIPCEISDGKGFYQRQEVLDLLNLLKTLANRQRSLELAGVLRSPFFGLDDESLTKLFFAGAGCLWDALMRAGANAGEDNQENKNSTENKTEDKMEDEPAHAAENNADEENFSERFAPRQLLLVRRAAKILAELRAVASLADVPELLRQIWSRLSLEAVYAAAEGGAALAANARRLRTLAQEYCADHGASLGEWLDYVQRARAAEARVAAASADAADAVRIMTIHKAKGLEFKKVFLLYLDAKENASANPVLYAPGIGLGIKAPDAQGDLQESSVYQKLKELDKKLDLEERKRLLYVAMTRAEDGLIMSGTAAKKSDKDLSELSWFKQLAKIFEQSESVRLQEQGSARAGARAELSEPCAKITAEEEDFAQPTAAYLAGGMSEFSPSSLQTYLYCQRQYYYQYIIGLPPLEAQAAADGENGQENLSAKVLGSVVHLTLELYRGDLDAALARAVAEYAPTYRGSEAREILQRYLASDLYQSLSAQQLREQPFTLYDADNGFVFRGIIDCLARRADGSLLVVDYKSGRPHADAEQLKGYACQLAIYQKAAQNAGTDVKTVDAQLHFLRAAGGENACWDLAQANAGGCGRDFYAEAVALAREINMKREAEEFAGREEIPGAEAGLASCAFCPYNYVCDKAE